MSEQRRRAGARGTGDARRDTTSGRGRRRDDARPQGRPQRKARDTQGSARASEVRGSGDRRPAERTAAARKPAQRPAAARKPVRHPEPTRKPTTRPAGRPAATRVSARPAARPQTAVASNRTPRQERRDVTGMRSSQTAATSAYLVRNGRSAGTPARSRTTNKPFTTREPTNARSRRQRQQRVAAARRRHVRLALDVTIIVVSLALVVIVSRVAIGLVAGLFEKPAPKGDQEATPAVAKGSDVTVDLVMIGDVLQHSGVYQSGFAADGTRNYDHIFAHITGEIAGADLKVVNQETVLGGTRFEFSGYPSFNGPQEMGDAEAKVGFNVVLRATNHALDMGYEGLSSELSFWRQSHPEVTVIGAVDPNDATASVDDVYVFEKDGFKVALLNYTYDLNGYEDPRGVVSMLTEGHVRQTVSAAHVMADMVVVFPHWGEEYMLEPVASQRAMAQVFVDSGADVIIGGHPHVIEPVEVLTASDGRKVPCFWSVGNFVSTQVDNQNLIGGVAKVTLHKAPDGSCSIEGCSFVPTVTHKGVGTDMTTYLLRDYTDNLAATNYLEANETNNTDLTLAWANSFCTQVLGPGFDAGSERFVLGPEAFEPTATGASASSGTADEAGAASPEQQDLPAAA